MREDHGCYCGQCMHTICKEFQLKHLSLKHQPVDDFFKSQWQKGDKSICWLIYRWLLAAFFSAGVIGSLIQIWMDGKWFIYLTDWGFLLCMLTCVYGAVLVTLYYWDLCKFEVDHWALKIYWFIHWTTLIVAIVITVMFWIFIYPSLGLGDFPVYGIWSHALNSVFMFIDHLLVAFPTRLLHTIYPLIFSLIYGLFNLVYYLAGGTDYFNNRYIYEVLDWTKPGICIAILASAFVLVIISSFIMFGFYKMRCNIYSKINQTKLTIRQV